MIPGRNDDCNRIFIKAPSHFFLVKKYRKVQKSTKVYFSLDSGPRGDSHLINKGPSILLSICSDIFPNNFISKKAQSCPGIICCLEKHFKFEILKSALRQASQVLFSNWRILDWDETNLNGQLAPVWTVRATMIRTSLCFQKFFSRISLIEPSLTLVLCWGRLCRCWLWRSLLKLSLRFCVGDFCAGRFCVGGDNLPLASSVFRHSSPFSRGVNIYNIISFETSRGKMNEAAKTLDK